MSNIHTWEELIDSQDFDHGQGFVEIDDFYELEKENKILKRIETDYKDFLAFILDNNGCGDVVGCANFNKRRFNDFQKEIKGLRNERKNCNRM